MKKLKLITFIALTATSLLFTSCEKEDNPMTSKTNLFPAYNEANKKGEFEIPATYDNAKPFYNGYAVVSTNDKFGVIDTKGNLVIPATYSGNSNKYFLNGLILMYNINSDSSTTFSYVNKKGEVVFSWKKKNEADYSAPQKTEKLNKEPYNYTPLELEGHFTLGI